MGTRRGALAPIATLVLQSHRQPLPVSWLERCLASAKAWAAGQGFGYEFIGDELFEGIPQAVLHNTSERLTARSDLARLLRIRERLESGADRVLWLDADVLVFDPSSLQLPKVPFAVGRECWFEARDGKLRIGRAVHNAVLLFERDNPFLDFYTWSAERMLARHDGPMVPQLVGPKLLTLLHNAIELPVIESVGVASPALIESLARDDHEPFKKVCDAHKGQLAALNLSASIANRDATVDSAIEALLASGRKDAIEERR